MNRFFLLLLIGFQVLFPSAAGAEQGLTVKGIRYFSYASFTRIVFEVESSAPYTVTKPADSREILFAAYEGPLTVKAPLPVISDGIISGVQVREEAGRNVIVMRLDAGAGGVKDFVLRGPDRIVLDILKGSAQTATAPAGEKTITVAIDPGHGGKDTGIVTAQGQEKSVTLELARSIRKLLQKNQRFKVVLTRDKDQELSLDERAAIAHAGGASVFVSLHSSAGPVNRIYIQDPGEDQGSQQRPMGRDFLGFESGSSEQENVWGRQQAAHGKESGALGRVLARQLTAGPKGEPVQAPLAGLKAVDAAAVLVEVGMEQDRSGVAEAVARGIELHVDQNR